jgi:hypothetical protein
MAFIFTGFIKEKITRNAKDSSPIRVIRLFRPINIHVLVPRDYEGKTFAFGMPMAGLGSGRSNLNFSSMQRTLSSQEHLAVYSGIVK